MMHPDNIEVSDGDNYSGDSVTEECSLPKEVEDGGDVWLGPEAGTSSGGPRTRSDGRPLRPPDTVPFRLVRVWVIHGRGPMAVPR